MIRFIVEGIFVVVFIDCKLVGIMIIVLGLRESFGLCIFGGVFLSIERFGLRRRFLKYVVV